MTTLLALYRRPDGGPEAQATFEHRYTTEHLPLVAGTPGLRVNHNLNLHVEGFAVKVK